MVGLVFNAAAAAATRARERHDPLSCAASSGATWNSDWQRTERVPGSD
jgi:hypothetical protein